MRECGWTADQVVITNGESGYRYAALAETFYGVSLAATGEGRANLSEIRKKEARNATAAATTEGQPPRLGRRGVAGAAPVE